MKNAVHRLTKCTLPPYTSCTHVVAFARSGHKCDLTEQKRRYRSCIVAFNRCTLVRADVCNMHHKGILQIAHFHSNCAHPHRRFCSVRPQLWKIIGTCMHTLFCQIHKSYQTVWRNIPKNRQLPCMFLRKLILTDHPWNGNGLLGLIML